MTTQGKLVHLGLLPSQVKDPDFRIFEKRKRQKLKSCGEILLPKQQVKQRLSQWSLKSTQHLSAEDIHNQRVTVCSLCTPEPHHSKSSRLNKLQNCTHMVVQNVLTRDTPAEAGLGVGFVLAVTVTMETSTSQL